MRTIQVQPHAIRSSNVVTRPSAMENRPPGAIRSAYEYGRVQKGFEGGFQSDSSSQNNPGQSF